MSFEQMKQRILAMPEVAGWPEMVEIVGRAVHGREEAAVPAAAAICCSLASVHLVDDMLDDDPAGDYHTLGTGKTANIALAFQAAAHRALDEAAADGETRAALQACLARMALATAYGQNLDTRDVRSEEDYWRAVETKTPPLFGTAFHLGARLGGAAVPLAAELERLGGVIGLYIQVSDDLYDALKVPAVADWHRRYNNLPILYALTAEHAEREEFARLSLHPEDPEALAAAQKILLRSGAVSYCALKMIELSRQAQAILARLPLHSPEPIAQLLSNQRTPLDRLFRSVGVEMPAAFSAD